MVRSRPTITSSQRTHSIANPTVYSGGLPDAPPKDRRGHTNNRALQGLGLCSVCEVEVALRKVSRDNPSRYADLPAGTIVAGSHRSGGGAYSVRRGDALCSGAGMPPSESGGVL